MHLVFIFFKQKPAYEVRISDWSSDVCSSDLEFGADAIADLGRGPAVGLPRAEAADPLAACALDHREHRKAADMPGARERAPLAPRRRTRAGAADEAHRFLFGAHFGEGVEILRRRGAEDQALGDERGSVEHADPLFRLASGDASAARDRKSVV